MTERSIRDVLDVTEVDSWVQCVATLVAGGHHHVTRCANEIQRLHALRLAHAALLFAQETHLAHEVRQRLEDIA